MAPTAPPIDPTTPLVFTHSGVLGTDDLRMRYSTDKPDFGVFGRPRRSVHRIELSPAPLLFDDRVVLDDDDDDAVVIVLPAPVAAVVVDEPCGLASAFVVVQLTTDDEETPVVAPG